MSAAMCVSGTDHIVMDVMSVAWIADVVMVVIMGVIIMTVAVNAIMTVTVDSVMTVPVNMTCTMIMPTFS